MGKVHLYTGYGKGKTTASIGLALRGIGHGLTAYMVQFLKGGQYTGEYIAAEKYLHNFRIDQVGKPCIRQTKQKTLLGFNAEHDTEGFEVREAIECGACRFCFQIDDQDRKNTQKAFFYLESLIRGGDMDIVILDEITYVINEGFISVEAIINMLNERHEKVEVIMTGRDPPQALIDACDLVSEIKLVKHYYNDGQIARPGIEY